MTPRADSIAARDGVELTEWLATAARCSTDGIYSAQLGNELRKISGRLTFIVDELIRIRLAVDPPVDCPRERV